MVCVIALVAGQVVRKASLAAEEEEEPVWPWRRVR